MSEIGPLKGARIWLSGALSPEVDGETLDSFNSFVAQLSARIFRAGGAIIHGAHPSITPLLLRSADDHVAAKGTRDCLTLAPSKFYRARYGEKLEDWKARCIVREVPAVENDEQASQDRMQRWMADRCDAIISVGGRWWKENPSAAGVPREFELARQRGLPGFLLAGLGGAAAGYLGAHPEIMRNLRNGLDEAQNLAFAAERDPEALANRVVEQLCRLPLVRGEALGDTTFRILSLDGGGIKGAFTAAVLAAWEETLPCKITDHFDMIAGTSTGGILALGLGMGLSVAQIKDFYEKRGPIIFPITSVRDKARFSLRQLFKPKYDQDTLRNELVDAFGMAPGKVISDSACRLVIPAVHARTGSVHVFRTNHHPSLIADRGRSAVDVACATSAAPTYFQAADIDDNAYVDGGVWANNPALAALTEAVSRLHVPLNRIDILSIGTTSEPYSGRQTARSGYAGWLKGGRIVKLLMHAQEQGTVELASNLAGRPRLLRIDEMLAPGEVSLDNVSRIPDLLNYGGSVALKADTIEDVKARFLNGVKVEPWPRH